MLDVLWLVPALPLAGFALLLVFGRRLGDPWAGWLATLLVAGSFAATVVAFFGLLDREGEARHFTQTLFTWVPAGALEVEAGLLADPLSLTMALFVTGVSALIHLYAIGYMRGDPGYSRFFLYLNLFVFSMTTLVLADNFLLMFLGWEGVGACSYLLISFWFQRESAASAGKKAFVVNRIGDWGFMVATFLIFATFGSLQYADVFAAADELTEVTATAIALLLFVGAAGKSAQLPLYVWLPDAMEGPTPVSALIHAATMVTAGVYLMARASPILEVAPDALTVIAVVGAVTALFAATIACAQDDIKRVLAYSTISQLGYMFLAVGSGAYVAAIFHMVTHAFFKALLFLGAGSVIHGLGAVWPNLTAGDRPEHEGDQANVAHSSGSQGEHGQSISGSQVRPEQDMKRMGALRKLMPVTAATFVVGWLAIAGVPPFSGFWSKDDILLAAWDKHVLLWVVGAVTALLTAYYMSRQVFLVFFGDERWRHAAEPKSEAEAEAIPEHEPAAAAGASASHTVAVDEHHAAEPHESPAVMAIPLVVLAALAAVGGLLNLPFEGWKLLEDWLHPVVGEHHLDVASGEKLTLIVAVAGLALGGIVVARQIWLRGAVRASALEPPVLRRAWGVDALYSAVIETPGRLLAAWLAFVFDVRVVDGAVNGVARLVQATGDRLRRAQTGYVRNYALGVASGAVLILAFVISRAGL